MGGMRKIGAGAIAAACLFSAGRCSAGDRGIPPPAGERESTLPDTRVVVKEKVTTKEVTKYVTPDSCVSALDYLDKISSTASKLADVGTPQLDIMSGAHQAIAGKDYQKLVTLQEDQMKINDSTVEYVKALEVDWLPRLRGYARQCRQASKR